MGTSTYAHLVTLTVQRSALGRTSVGFRWATLAVYDAASLAGAPNLLFPIIAFKY